MPVLDCSAFENAISQLEKSMSYLNSDASRNDSNLRDQFRAAVIQAFEFTYELGTKMIRRQLGQIAANPGELREMNFLDLIRTAADAGLVRSVPPFKVYREMRNLTAHTYDGAKAEMVLSSMSSFLEDMRFLLGELQRRNNEAN
ncbi:MAG: HI0074 family nucleotidyltransferase substrate-binding subunit [Candidatus Brocadiia bacterium]